MATTKIKFQPPERLPADGVTRIQFKAWKTTLLIYLKQNADFRLFLSGGKYQEWKSAEKVPLRIEELHANDQPGDRETAEDRLVDRQTQLETLLGLVSAVVNTSQFEDVMVRSTGL